MNQSVVTRLEYETLRVKLGGGAPLPMHLWQDELGLQPHDVTHIKRLRSHQSIGRRRIGALVRVLALFPELAQNKPHTLAEGLALIRSIKGHEKATLAELAVLLGCDRSTAARWKQGATPSPLTQQLLGILVRGLSQVQGKRRAAFLTAFKAARDSVPRPQGDGATIPLHQTQ